MLRKDNNILKLRRRSQRNKTYWDNRNKIKDKWRNLAILSVLHNFTDIGRSTTWENTSFSYVSRMSKVYQKFGTKVREISAPLN